MSGPVVVGIIGTGWVGASVAISTLHHAVAEEVLLHDVRAGIAEGEAMDLSHGAPFYAPAVVRAASIDDMIRSDAVVIAAGRGGAPGESRLALLADNVRVVREIAVRFRGYSGVVIVVTNPVDVLTREFVIASQLPPARVIGTGTMLDTARLRQVIGRTLDVSPTSVHANVVGEHGDSEVVLWSSARAAGVPLRAWPGWNDATERRLADEVRTAAAEIIKRKGATNQAIGLVTATLLGAVLRGENRVLSVSRVQEGALGVYDLALSLPAVVGRGGAVRIVPPDCDEQERAAIDRSAAVLRAAIASVAA
jgi:L-lactate dehydrogenase